MYVKKTVYSIISVYQGMAITNLSSRRRKLCENKNRTNKNFSHLSRRVIPAGLYNTKSLNILKTIAGLKVPDDI